MTSRPLASTGVAVAVFVSVAWLSSGDPTVVILGCLVILALLIALVSSRRPRSRSRRQRLLDDCEQQHAALMRGDDRYGYFGNFPVVAAWSEGEPPTSTRWLDPFTYENSRKKS